MSVLAFLRRIMTLCCLVALPTLANAEAPRQVQLAVQVGHSGDVMQADWSFDGRYVVTRGGDSTLRIWDAATGKVLSHVPTEGVTCAAFSRHELRIAFGTGSGKLSVWDVEAGKISVSMQVGERIDELVWSPDSKYVATLSSSAVMVWKVATGQRLSKFIRERGAKAPMAWAPSGRHVVTGVTIWENPSGRAVTRLPGLPFESGTENRVAFSGDGKTLASSFKKKVYVYDTESWTLLGQFNAPGDVTELLWHPKKRELVLRLDDRLLLAPLASNASAAKFTELLRDLPVEAMAWSPDRSMLGAITRTGMLFLWSDDGRLIKKLRAQDPGHLRLRWSPDSRQLLSSGSRAVTRIWDVSRGVLARELKGQVRPLTALAWSKEGRYLASGGEDTIRVWDLKSGQVTAALEPPREIDEGHLLFWQLGAEFLSKPDRPAETRALVWTSPFKLAALTISGQAHLNHWDVLAGGKTLWTKPIGHDLADALAVSPDGSLLATGGSARAAGSFATKLWAAGTGDLRRGFDADRSDGLHRSTTSLAWSPDGKHLARGGQRGFIDTTNNSTARGIIEGRLVAWSPSGRMVAMVLADGDRIRIVDFHDERKLIELFGHPVSSLAWSPNGAYLAVAGEGGLATYDRKWVRKELWSAGSGVDAVAWSPDSRILAGASGDGSTRLWEAASSRLLATLLTLEEGTDWLAVTPDGLFDGSPRGWQSIAWRLDKVHTQVTPAELFFREFFYPGLLPELLSGGRPAAPARIQELDRRQPVVQLKLAATPAIDPRQAELEVRVSQVPAKGDVPASGVQDLRIFRDGLLVRVLRGNIIGSEESKRFAISIPITAGLNQFTAYAFNRHNIKGEDAQLQIEGPKSLERQGSVHILAIGIDDYGSPGMNLTYAAADANEFADQIALAQRNIAPARPIQQIRLLDARATKAVISAALRTLEALGPEDTLFIHFSGHGVAFENKFLLLARGAQLTSAGTPMDKASFTRLGEDAISVEELQSALEGIVAQHIVLVLDTCYSGQSLESEDRRQGPMNIPGLAQLAYEKGMYIITAAQAQQQAIESQALKHGALTYALVKEGIGSFSADTEPKDGTVSVHEWLRYAVGRVPELHFEALAAKKGLKLGPETFDPLDAREAHAQEPRVFYKREHERDPLVIARATASDATGDSARGATP